METCSVGHHLKEHCLTQLEGSQDNLVSCSELCEEERELLILRTKCVNLENICNQHLHAFLSTFEDRQRVCCDPFKRHKKNIYKCLKTVSLPFSRKYEKWVKLIPGTKLCISCRKGVFSKCYSDNDLQSNLSGSDYEPDNSNYELIEKLNKSCELIESSPIKVTKRKLDERGVYLKNKAQRVARTFQQMANQALNVESSSGNNYSDLRDKQKCRDCSSLMYKLKEKFKSSKIDEQVQILTLVPQSWSIPQTISFFETTEYLVKKARKLLNEEGALGKVDKRKGRTLSAEIVQKVRNFYCEDDISRVSANKKDFVSLPTEHGKREFRTKRLILHNLKDVYLSFKEKNPEEKIGFTKFCELRPKECVTVNSRGIHSVCVCTYHQNVKLMIQSIHLSMPYQELLLKQVCNLESEECMLHRCPRCPDEAALRDFLMGLDYFGTKETITFKQWLHTDRSSLETLVKPVDEFVDFLVAKLVQLTKHHFIAKSQSLCLKQIKTNLDDQCCLILADFAENYTCILQDAAQGFHWNNIQVTLHPFVIYYKCEGELKSKCICFISDCLKHDTTAFFTFQKSVLQYLKQNCPYLTNVVYFSDGSSAQYKNYKNFINLCYHEEDYGMTAEWHFFATSHGKNACDGVGGTIKRLATRASLQRTVEGQILNAQDLFEFASKNIKGIQVFFTPSAEIGANEEFLKGRYANSLSIGGTRENHFFKPLDKNTLLVKRVSLSENSFRATVGVKTKEMVEITPEKFYAVLYDSKWWIGKILDNCGDERDAKVQFMHPPGPSPTYYWPTKNDCCWVPYENILKEIPVPSSSSVSARAYVIDDEVHKQVQKLAKRMM